MGVLMAIAGCGKPENSVPAQNAMESGQPTQAQAKLPTIKLYMGAAQVDAEVASTPLQLQTGMMFREKMGENEAMLFVFARPHRASFWMKNTKLPLSCAYIDSEGIILEIKELKPLDETSVPASSDLVQYVLETPLGWFERHNVQPGAAVGTDKGSLKDTFFRRN